MDSRYSSSSSPKNILTTTRTLSSNYSEKQDGCLDSSTNRSDTFWQKSPFEDMTIYSSSSIKSEIFKEKNLKTELQKTLMEFTMAYLTENPSDIIEYGVKHFTRMQERRKCSTESFTVLAKEIKAEGEITGRRRSVFSESYDPENDDQPSVVIPKTEEQYERLKRAVANIFVFRYLEEEQMSQVLNAMFERSVERGEIIIRQNDDGDYFYVVETGTFDIIHNGERVYTWRNTGAFGEVALMYQIKRTATVQATTNGLLWALDRQSFRKILLKHSYKKQKMYVEFLESVPLLKELCHWERLNLAEVLEPRYYKKGEVIVNQDDDADGMYFIEKGYVRVHVDRKKKGSIIVNRLSPSQYFGEVALLIHDKRQATVIADSDVKLAFLNKESFERLLGKCVDILNRGMEDYNLKDYRLSSYLASISSKPEDIE